MAGMTITMAKIIIFMVIKGLFLIRSVTFDSSSRSSFEASII